MPKRRRKPVRARNDWDWNLGAAKNDSDDGIIAPGRRDAFEPWELRHDAMGDDDDELIAEAIQEMAMRLAKAILQVREMGSMMQEQGMIENFDTDDLGHMAANLREYQQEMLGVMNRKDFSGYSDRDLGVAMEMSLNMMRQGMPQINQGAYPARPRVGARSRPMDPSAAQIRSMLDRFEKAEDAVFQEASAGGDYGHVAAMPMLPQPRVV